MKRSTPLKRSSFTAAARQGRKLLGQRGDLVAKPKRLTPSERAIRDAVFERDGGCVLAGVPGAGRCFGPPTPHHVLKSGQGGAYTFANLATLCAHHNGQIEADADLAALARSRGLVRFSWESDDQWNDVLVGLAIESWGDDLCW